MSETKDIIENHIWTAVSRFSDEMTFWSKTQFEKLLFSSSIGGPFSLTSNEVTEALQDLEAKEIVKFIGNNEYYIVLHPEYIKKNLSDYVMTASLKQVENIISKYCPQIP